MTYVTLPDANNHHLTDNALQPKPMALLPAHSQGHKWDPYTICTCCKRMWHISESKRIFVVELSVCVFIWSNVHLQVYWLEGISNRQSGVGGHTVLWIWHTKWVLLPSWCGVSRRSLTAASLPWCLISSCRVELGKSKVHWGLSNTWKSQY